jgi:enoyl-CoA hydratase/carnithine racemase
MSEFETIKFGFADGIAKITLNHPEAANVINATLVKELARGARGTPGAVQR